MTTYQFMVVNDTNNVIDYLFASTQYKMIRGASLLLDYLNTNATEKIITMYNGLKLSLGGGEGRVLFENEEDALAYEKALQQLYIQKTDQVTVSTVTVKRNESESMAQWLERSEQCLRLHEVTLGKKQLHHILLSPIMKRCESCYTRAAEFSAYNKEEEKVICKSCYLKRAQLAKVIKQVESKDIENKRDSGLSEIHQKLLTTQEGFDRSSWVKNVDGLLEEDNTVNRIGFIYADGKNIGALFKQALENEHLTDEAFIKQYKNKSEKLHDALIEAAVETHKKLATLGYENIAVDYAIVGGDDLAAILPGEVAPLYAYYLLKYFKEKTAHPDYLNSKCELAAGVIIAKKKYPISQLFQLSYDLMYRTKSRNKVGTFDVEILLDSYVQSIDAKRNTSPYEQKHQLYMEGYTVNEESDFSFEKLYETARALKKSKFPSSKIKGVYQLTVEKDEHMLSFKWKEWLTHLDKSHRQILIQNYKNIEHTPFCLQKEDKVYTPIRDLFEIYDFVKEELSNESIF